MNRFGEKRQLTSNRKHRRAPRCGSGHAFTLIELSVREAIIGILAALLLPVRSQAKQAGQRRIRLQSITDAARTSRTAPIGTETARRRDNTRWLSVRS
jgi:type II secretory pathway pseudopilin PulG